MIPYRLSTKALQDLKGIWDHIASDNLDAAESVELAVHKACESIASMPMAGVIRKDFTPLPVRFHLLLPYRTYWIVYDPASRPVEIVRILHTSIEISVALG